MQISKELALPLDVAGEAIAILAKRGAGKTNTATVLVEELVAAWPNEVTKDELADRVAMTASGGTFQTYLGTLRRNGLVDVHGAHVRASDTCSSGRAHDPPPRRARPAPDGEAHRTRTHHGGEGGTSPVSTSETGQTSIYETTLDNPDLEQLLERRQKAKDERSKTAAKFKEVDDLCKFKVTELDLGDAPVRVGRFVLTPKTIKARSVSFETEESHRVQISLLDD